MYNITYEIKKLKYYYFMLTADSASSGREKPIGKRVTCSGGNDVSVFVDQGSYLEWVLDPNLREARQKKIFSLKVEH